MIVKCDKCQTRFKIPDEKVTAKGVKVRCTRCQNTFRVAKSGAVMDATPTPSSTPTISAVAPASNPFSSFGSDPGEVDFSAPPEPTVNVPIPTAAQPNAQVRTARSAPPPPASFAHDEPVGAPTNGASGLHHDALFGDTDFSSTPDPLPSVAGTAFDRSAFAMPKTSATRASAALDAVSRGVPDEPVAELPRTPAKSPTPLRFSPTLEVMEAQAAVASHRKGTLRRALGLVANVVIATLLLGGIVSVGALYLAQGEVSFSTASLDAVRSLFEGPGDLLAVDVSNGLYETRGGRAVFYVRGEVENRGATPRRARVRVEILDDELKLTSSGVVAGRAPSAEELFAIEDAADLSRLTRSLEDDAMEVKAGGRVPFLVGFYEYPPELSQYRLRIVVEDAQVAAAR